MVGLVVERDNFYPTADKSFVFNFSDYRVAFHGSFADFPNLFFAAPLTYLTPDLTASSYVHETVAGQPDFKSKDFHPRMTTIMICTIQYDKYLCAKVAVMSSPLKMEFFNFMPNG